MDNCKTCKAEVEWAVTEQGNVMPLDAAPAPKGRWSLVDGKLKAYDLEDAALGRPRRQSHFASCPDADRHRRGAGEPTHRCAAEGCSTTIPVKLLMCRRHWFMVPKQVQAAVWAGYRGDAGSDYLRAVKAAVAAVAEREARS